MLPATHRLHRRADITHTIRRGRRASRGGLVVHLIPGGPDSSEPARAAFAVGKSVGNSVVRHRVLRRLRAVTLLALPGLAPGTQVVVRALPAAAEETSAQLAADLDGALDRVQRRGTGAGGAPPGSPTSAAGRGEPPPPVPQPGPTGEGRAAAESPQRPGIRDIFRVGPMPSGWRAAVWIIGLPLRIVLLTLVGLYRLVVSPLMPPTCRFHPSCSAYGLEALQVHGAVKGFCLASWRVLRCNPWNGGGLDPVPRRGMWLPDIYPDGRPRLGDPAHHGHTGA